METLRDKGPVAAPAPSATSNCRNRSQRPFDESSGSGSGGPRLADSWSKMQQLGSQQLGSLMPAAIKSKIGSEIADSPVLREALSLHMVTAEKILQ